jgi:hypothetical protein
MKTGKSARRYDESGFCIARKSCEAALDLFRISWINRPQLYT